MHTSRTLTKVLLVVLACMAVAASPTRASGDLDQVPGWKQANQSSFGDLNNRAISSLEILNETLYATTWNDDGGQIWQMLYQVNLPLVVNSFPPSGCTTIPALLSPANGANLDNLIPLFEWDAGNDPKADVLRLEVAQDAAFTNKWFSLYSGQTQGAGEHRFSRNLEPAKTYYWRAFLICGQNQAPYSATWTFKSGSGGTILPAPGLVAPPNGTVLPGTSVSWDWSPVNDAVEYLVFWGPTAEGWHYFDWVVDTQLTDDVLDAGKTYEWWVSARNDYAIGQDSATWNFSTPGGTVFEPNREMLENFDLVIDENGGWYYSRRVDR